MPKHIVLLMILVYNGGLVIGSLEHNTHHYNVVVVLPTGFRRPLICRNPL